MNAYRSTENVVTCYGRFDEAGNWVATDKDGNPLPIPEPREDRIAKALESIAASLEKLAHPPMLVPSGSPAFCNPTGACAQCAPVLEGLSAGEVISACEGAMSALAECPFSSGALATHFIKGGLRESGPA